MKIRALAALVTFFTAVTLSSCRNLYHLQQDCVESLKDYKYHTSKIPRHIQDEIDA